MTSTFGQFPFQSKQKKEDFLGPYSLHSSIFQYVCPMHPADFQAIVTNARDFEAAKLKANYA
ncbi:hypothetical protein G9A89_021846 [Geosiphon pyriformis]|nr:hypothetical protein G9A89_021846 [Geosiphon pyriformis]